MDASKQKPSAGQLEFMDWEFGVFFHFGIRTFFPGHSDFDGKKMPASAFNPSRLDCRQWCRIAKSAGARYAVLTARHGDGFCNWPSKHNDYSVKSSPWRDGNGDVVAEFVNECRKAGLKVGLYCSPAQWGGKIDFSDEDAYDEYYINLVTELLTSYGKIDYLWLDSFKSDGHQFNCKKIVDAIRALQPDILIFGMWDSDVRWVGNEAGCANMPNCNIVTSAEFKQFRDGSATRFLPAECDTKIRSEWFDCRANLDTLKSVEELLGIYEYSVGRGANLLLNVTVNRDGVIPEPDAVRMLEFGEALRRRWGRPLVFGSVRKQDETHYRICTAESDNRLCNRLEPMVDGALLEEDITDGESVRSFRLLAHLTGIWDKTQYICVYNGCGIGHKAICRFSPIRTDELVLRITEADGETRIKRFEAFYTLDK